MVEMRWVPPRLANSLSSEAMVTDDGDSLRVLQYRYVTFSDHIADEWSEWIDVPTVTEP